jgi:uncharacterized protein HemX
MIKKVGAVVVCALLLGGCVTSGRLRKAEQQQEVLRQTLVLEQTNAKAKDEKIAQLEDMAKSRDAELAEKNKRIDELKKKLEGFGVF